MSTACLDTTAMIGYENSEPVRVIIVEAHPAVRLALQNRLNAAANVTVVEADQDLPMAVRSLSRLARNSASISRVDILIYGLQNRMEDTLPEVLACVESLGRSGMAVIVLAPFVAEDQRMRFQKAGVSRFLLKEIDSPGLIQAIYEVAGES